MGFEQEFYSIVSFVEGIGDKMPSYYNEMPQTEQRPVRYFPRPDVTTAQKTTNHFAYSYTFIVQMFDKTSSDAYNKIIEIADAINKNRMRIPINDINGKATGDYIRFSRVDFRKSAEGVATLTMDYESFEPFTVQTHGLIEKIFINFKVKE